jgi:hypothetical protein
MAAGSSITIAVKLRLLLQTHSVFVAVLSAVATQFEAVSTALANVSATAELAGSVVRSDFLLVLHPGRCHRVCASCLQVLLVLLPTRQELMTDADMLGRWSATRIQQTCLTLLAAKQLQTGAICTLCGEFQQQRCCSAC